MLTLGMIFVVGSVVHDWRGYLVNGQRPLSEDFGVFYCAGAAVNELRDPYLTRNLDRCGDGRHTKPVQIYVHRQPAPVPGYDIALFRIFVNIAFPPAAVIWLAISAVAVVVGVLALSSISTLPAAVIFLAVAPTMRESLRYGQLPPLLFVALALSGYALLKGKHRLAALAALGALIEPHVGLPVAIAMFLWVPQSRVTLSVGVVCLAAISLATLGLAANIDYVRVVLPSQVLAEAPSDSQYSLTWLLSFLGVSEPKAIALGGLQYALTIVAGTVAAKLVAGRLRLPAAIPLIAAAFAVIGGPFIHSYHVATAAILGAAVIAGRKDSAFAWIALLLVCVSWDGDATWLVKPWSISRFESALIAAVMCAYALRRRAVAVGFGAALAVLLVYFGFTSAILGTSRHQIRTLESPASFAREHASERAYSSFEWGLLLRSTTQFPSPQALMTKLPSWLGLIFLVGSITTVVGREPGAEQRRGTYEVSAGRAA